MKHTCHAIDCKVTVEPKFFMCRKHWFMVPVQMRDAIWAAYEPGQEIHKNPSDKYLLATWQAKIEVAILEGKYNREQGEQLMEKRRAFLLKSSSI